MNDCIFCDKNGIFSNSLIYTGTYWKVYLANNQDYIGRLIITTRNHITIDKCDDKFILELYQIINKYKHIYHNRLNTKMVNLAYLMNSFAKKDENLWHVHVHFIPRTDTTININGHIYKDINYGEHYIPNREVFISDEDRNYLINLIKN